MTPPSRFKRRDFLVGGALAGAALGGSIRGGEARAGVDDPSTDRKPLPFRECYCPAHFGNSYEAMWPRERAAHLAELKAMGFNRLGDWLVTTDARDPYTTDKAWHLGRVQLERKKQAFRDARALGLDLNLIVTPNHVYLDQLRPELEATKSSKIFGQLLCPSRPEARKIILNNFVHWCDDLADAGLRLSAFTAFAYDYGGCDCEACRPWILTFARLMKEIHALAKERHPDIEPWFCSWWWTPEEHALVNDWAAREAPGWLQGMTMHIEYGQTHPKEVEVPEGCRKLAFVHIGYPDERSPEVYGRQGAVIAPNRLPKTVDELRARGFEGFQAYSEGVFDDANKAILAGLADGRFGSANEAMRDYAERYLGAKAERSKAWAAWLTRWGDAKSVPLPAAQTEFDRLAADAKPGWRLEHWRVKLEMERLDRAIGRPKPDEWTPEQLANADAWFAAQEHLYRDIYRLGPVRHVLHPGFQPPAWRDSWSQATQAAPAPASPPDPSEA